MSQSGGDKVTCTIVVQGVVDTINTGSASSSNNNNNSQTNNTTGQWFLGDLVGVVIVGLIVVLCYYMKVGYL